MNKYAQKNRIRRAGKLLTLSAVGVLIGFLNGFFGGGGGMLLVPLLAFTLKLSVKQSHATSIAIILPLSVVSAAMYYAKGVQLSGVFTPAAIGVLAGGVVGAALLKKLSGKAISTIFYFVMIIAGVRMMIG